MEGMKYFKMAKQQGDELRALTNIAITYDIMKNNERATKYFDKSAELGLYSYIYEYLDGKETKKDMLLKYCLHGCEKGDKLSSEKLNSIFNTKEFLDYDTLQKSIRYLTPENKAKLLEIINPYVKLAQLFE